MTNAHTNSDKTTTNTTAVKCITVRRKEKLVIIIICTVFRKIKTPTFVFDYNSGVSWSILIFLYQWKQE